MDGKVPGRVARAQAQGPTACQSHCSGRGLELRWAGGQMLIIRFSLTLTPLPVGKSGNERSGMRIAGAHQSHVNERRGRPAASRHLARGWTCVVGRVATAKTLSHDSHVLDTIVAASRGRRGQTEGAGENNVDEMREAVGWSGKAGADRD